MIFINKVLSNSFTIKTTNKYIKGCQKIKPITFYVIIFYWKAKLSYHIQSLLCNTHLLLIYSLSLILMEQCFKRSCNSSKNCTPWWCTHTDAHTRTHRVRKKENERVRVWEKQCIKSGLIKIWFIKFNSDRIMHLPTYSFL